MKNIPAISPVVTQSQIKQKFFFLRHDINFIYSGLVHLQAYIGSARVHPGGNLWDETGES